MEQATKEFRSARKLQDAVVVSDKMDKTRVVQVAWSFKHPRYQKIMRRVTRFYAHDDKNESHTGDRVEIMETRPLSKLKRWRITRILGKNTL